MAAFAIGLHSHNIKNYLFIFLRSFEILVLWFHCCFTISTKQWILLRKGKAPNNIPSPWTTLKKFIETLIQIPAMHLLFYQMSKTAFKTMLREEMFLKQRLFKGWSMVFDYFAWFRLGVIDNLQRYSCCNTTSQMHSVQNSLFWQKLTQPAIWNSWDRIFEKLWLRMLPASLNTILVPLPTCICGDCVVRRSSIFENVTWVAIIDAGLRRVNRDTHFWSSLGSGYAGHPWIRSCDYGMTDIIENANGYSWYKTESSVDKASNT